MPPGSGIRAQAEWGNTRRVVNYPPLGFTFERRSGINCEVT